MREGNFCEKKRLNIMAKRQERWIERPWFASVGDRILFTKLYWRVLCHVRLDRETFPHPRFPHSRLRIRIEPTWALHSHTVDYLINYSCLIAVVKTGLVLNSYACANTLNYIPVARGLSLPGPVPRSTAGRWFLIKIYRNVWYFQGWEDLRGI